MCYNVLSHPSLIFLVVCNCRCFHLELNPWMMDQLELLGKNFHHEHVPSFYVSKMKRREINLMRKLRKGMKLWKLLLYLSSELYAQNTKVGNLLYIIRINNWCRLLFVVYFKAYVTNISVIQFLPLFDKNFLVVNGMSDFI